MTQHTSKNQGRSSSAPTNAQRGAALEDAIQWTHNIYAANGRGFFWQHGVKSVIRRGQVIQLRSMPDFGGVITSLGGKFVCFDAKMVSASKIGKTGSIRYQHPADRLHQLKTLWEVQEAGGIGFLLVSIELQRFFLLWPQISWRDERPYSIRLDGIQSRDGIEFDRSGGYGLPSWLDEVEKLYASGSAVQS
jgi:penicillin-binding protein-related factor A (putative recombinase)